MKRFSVALLLGLCFSAAQSEDFDFDISRYEKKPYELGGFVQLRSEYLNFNQDGALYQLNFPASGARPDSDTRYAGALELNGLYRFGDSSVNFLGHAEIRHDYFGEENAADFYELYYRQADDKFGFELGKRAIKWGKGYAWNPVGFIERRKDPGDPELSREGYVLASLDYVKSLSGPLQMISFTPVLLPVSDDLNSDFAREEATNFAGKISVLYRDTDVDLLFLTEGSRSSRVGLDFSRNLKPNLEVHGELAWINDNTRRLLNDEFVLVTEEKDSVSYLLGVRYLTEQDTTWILEYYHNGAGLRDDEMDRFFKLVDSAESTGDPVLLTRANAARNAGFAAPNMMRDYLYLRASQKDIFGVVYLNAGLSAILNLNDKSYNLIPEITYTGISDIELRLHATLTGGNSDTEYGEKQNDNRIELRARYFF